MKTKNIIKDLINILINNDLDKNAIKYVLDKK